MNILLFFKRYIKTTRIANQIKRIREQLSARTYAQKLLSTRQKTRSQFAIWLQLHSTDMSTKRREPMIS
jgi:hypothetical protein